MTNDPKTKKYFRGCMPKDHLPSQLEKKSLYVINLSPSTSAGSHWVLLSTLKEKYSAYVVM